MPSLIVQPRAQLDIDDALTWYHPRNPTLVPRFLTELDSVFDRISQNPAQFPVEADPIQRALLRKFPFSVFFLVEGDLAAIVAVLHQSRRPVIGNVDRLPANKPLKADGRTSSPPALASLSPVVKYHGLARRFRTARAFLDAAAA